MAAPDHPIHQEPEPLSEVTRVKYRGVAVADTARERPVLTVQLLDKQPRLTVSTIEDKRQALLAGLGVATMPYPLVEQDIAQGRLRVVSPESTSEIDIIMAWRRGQHGRGESLVPAGNPETVCQQIRAQARFSRMVVQALA
ncbi:LysR family transcriptional regulator [Citrobacter koseri]|uniref:LysR family transcriptional regulator n=1 Tax=Citrobacter koseri TaxID=545 RepID=A0A2X2W866_CITKO|nr:LysR family transcriptional regulator [Citrobacter koseri]